MPVNSFSFKIDVPTSNIPIATSLAVTTGSSPPETTPSGATEFSSLQYSSTGATITVPNNNGVLVIKSSVSRYQVLWMVNRTGTSRSIQYSDPIYYIVLSATNSSGISFYGTDGVLSDMLLATFTDIANDTENSISNISTKCLLLSLPDDS